MTKREAKAVEITREMKNWNTGTDAMIMETPTFRCVLEAMDWMAQECAGELTNAVSIIDRSDPYPPEVEFDRSVILNAGKDIA